MNLNYALLPSRRLGLGENSPPFRQTGIPTIASLALVLTAVHTTQPNGSWYQRIALPLERSGTEPTIPMMTLAATVQRKSSGSSILDLIDRLHATITEEEWARTPTDLASNIDEVVYGA